VLNLTKFSNSAHNYYFDSSTKLLPDMYSKFEDFSAISFFPCNISEFYEININILTRIEFTVREEEFLERIVCIHREIPISIAKIFRALCARSRNKFAVIRSTWLVIDLFDMPLDKRKRHRR